MDRKVELGVQKNVKEIPKKKLQLQTRAISSGAYLQFTLERFFSYVTNGLGFLQPLTR